MITIRRAIPDDTATVHAILRHAASWLHERGYDQWPDGSPSLSYDQLLRQIGRGETWLVSDGRDPIATIAVTSQGDPDFWTPDELAEAAAYISKAAVVRSQAGKGLGALILRWVVDHAAEQGAVWARLDAWRTNHELHAYYLRQGWDYLRTVGPPHRRSGALFQRPADADPQARAALIWQDLPARLRRPPLEPGSAVITNTPDGPVAATIARIIGPDWNAAEVEQGWETGTSGPPIDYAVTRAGRTWTPAPGQLWPDPARETVVKAGELPLPR
jgi:GNAT superfamily N-acetyltransferase